METEKVINDDADKAKAGWVFIENEGALFRGPSRGNPMEVWKPSLGAFAPYAMAGKPRDISWGHDITEEEAKALMGGQAPGEEPAAEPGAGAPPPEPKPE